MNLTKTSIYLSLLLRHAPQKVGLTLDSNGWAKVEDLIRLMPISLENLKKIVESDSKGRYAFSEDFTRIRAVQGHSIKVDLGLPSKEPPIYLYHGTCANYLDKIFSTGISKMSRNYVHLSEDIGTALVVAKRRPPIAILRIYAKAMAKNGYTFYQSQNNVWLTEVVPRNYIQELRV